MAQTLYPRWLDGRSPFSTGDELCPWVHLREVGPGLFVSAVDVADSQTRALPRLRGLLRVGNAPERIFPPTRAYTHIPFPDCAVVPDATLAACLEFYMEQGEPFLVMCDAGMSRSASLAYLFLRTRYNLSHDDAVQRVRLSPSMTMWPDERVLSSCRSFYNRCVRS